LSAFLFFELV